MEETPTPQIPVQPTPIQKKDNTLTIIFALSTIIASVVAVFFFLQNQKLKNEYLKSIPAVIQTPEEKKDSTTEWIIYSDSNRFFEFKFPNENFEIHNYGSVEEILSYFALIYKTTDASENLMRPGIDISVYKNANKLDLDEWIEKYESAEEKHYRDVSNKQNVEIGTLQAISFDHEVQGPIAHTTLFSYKDYIYSFSYIKNKESESLINTYNQILTTIKFTE